MFGKKSKEKVIRVHLKSQAYNSVKTIRVPEKAKSIEIIKEALSKNHIPLAELDQYEIVAPTDGGDDLVEIVLKNKGSPSQAAPDKAFINPLYGNADATEEGGDRGSSGGGGDYEEVDKDVYELLEKETELRQGAEARALKAEQGLAIALHRIKDLEALVEQLKEQVKGAVASEASDEAEKLKKKNVKLKVELDKLKTSLEIKEEIIGDLKAELKELREGGGDSGVHAEGEEELSDYMKRAAIGFQKSS